MRINYQFQLIQAIRNFFIKEGFTDVLTPPIVSNPGMETHIHPFQIKSTYKKKDLNLFLHTSPEFHMKELLSLPEEQLEKIFTINYVFRDEPNSPIHRSQFIMLEWYRAFEHYDKIMQDTLALIKNCYEDLAKSNLPLKKQYENFEGKNVTVQELFQEHCNFDILQFLEAEELERKLRADFKDVPVPESKLIYEDSFFLLFLNKIEPHFKNYPYLLVKEYPAPLAALSTLKPSDPRVCERFEVYLEGIELCNCFNELTDFKIQNDRFQFQNQQKRELYNYSLPEPSVLYDSLKRGLPRSSGIALGVERLLTCLVETKNPFYQ